MKEIGRAPCGTMPNAAMRGDLCSMAEPKKPTTRTTAAGKAPKKTVKKVSKAPAKTVAKKPTVKLLSGGNPQIAKGTGDVKVQEFIHAMPGWKQDIGRWLDELITRTVPGVHRAVKWNTPFYGTDTATWFIAFHCLNRYVKVAFSMGTHLKPPPPGTSKQKDVRYLDLYEDSELDEKQVATWIKQAAKLPGEKW